MSHTKAILVAFALPLVIAALWQEGICQKREKTRTAVTKKMDSVRQGRWGGRGVILDVTESGAVIEFDCASGAINEPMALDKNNRFEAKGTHMTERPGPVRMGQEDGEQSALYTGSVDAETLTLTIELTGAKQIIGTFTLAFGKSSRLRKCL